VAEVREAVDFLRYYGRQASGIDNEVTVLWDLWLDQP
jgi:delta 1-pyrroline-5-carboxylate dehydrogenase